MKIKEGYMLREIAGNFVVVPVGIASKEFNGVITLNSTGAFLWKELMNGLSITDLIDRLVATYEVEKEVAAKDVNNFVSILKGANLVE